MKREKKRVKKFGVISVLNKTDKRSKKGVVFCLFRPFRESEKVMCEKIFSKLAKFFLHVRLLKAVFFLQILMIMRFDYDIVLILGLVWWELKFSNSKFNFNANLEVFDQFC